MGILKKINKSNGDREIYLLGIKLFTYKSLSWKRSHKLHSKIEKELLSFNELGVNVEMQRTPRVIVSLTSYPARMNSIHTCLHSLLTQSFKPDMVILWLAKENFPGGEQDLPDKVLQLKNNGLTIKWCADLKSYKKLIPALQEYPDDIIVTADDDIIYSQEWLQKLYESYQKYPNDINVHRVTRFEYHNGWVTAGHTPYSQSSFLNKLTGCGGVLYPPHSLYKDICSERLFMKLAPTNDDQWFWFQAILNDRKVRVVENNESNLIYTHESQDVALCRINDDGPKLFWKDFSNLLGYYPIVQEKMYKEARMRSKL